MMAGAIGVALWPMLLFGWMTTYPGPAHARLMIHGFFGGFILGFMGTAMPRLVDARPFNAREAFGLLALFFAHLIAATCNALTLADALFIAEFVTLFLLLRRRFHSGGGMPPPSFSLVGLGLGSALVGAALQFIGREWELPSGLDALSRLLAYHAFVLLSVLGAGGFLLPRFLGLGVRRKLPAGDGATPEWRRAARIARSFGLAILGSYGLEAFGWPRAAGVLRAGLVTGWFIYEMPLERLRWSWAGVQWQLVVGLACIPLGILLAALHPAARVTWLHIELIGGFAMITAGVAARVVYGHTGGRPLLERFHWPLTVGGVLMLLGLLSRLVGDLVPSIQTSHYIYAALTWLAGAGVWAACLWPRLTRPDPEADGDA